MTILPKSREAQIVVQEIESEILIYDLNINKAFALNETAATVYRACDGKTSFDELKLKSKFTDEIIFLALDELKKDNLLKENDSYNSPFVGMNRREIIRQVGLASMIALPVIASLVAPTSAMAQSIVCVNPGGAQPGMNVSNCTTEPGGCVGPCQAPGIRAGCCSNMTTVGPCSPSPFPGQETCPCVCIA